MGREFGRLFAALLRFPLFAYLLLLLLLYRFFRPVFHVWSTISGGPDVG